MVKTRDEYSAENKKYNHRFKLKACTEQTAYYPLKVLLFHSLTQFRSFYEDR